MYSAYKLKYDLNQISYDYTVEGTNMWKGLDLTDRVPEELWMEVVDIVQESVIKTIPQKKKRKKSKWSEEALQIAEKRREVKDKREKERYIHLNAEFQRITRDKIFLSELCKEIEKNNRKGKTRDLFRKIGTIKGIFWPKMDTIKDRNGMDLTEAENTKKRWQEYIENCTKNIIMTQITMMVWSLT